MPKEHKCEALINSDSEATIVFVEKNLAHNGYWFAYGEDDYAGITRLVYCPYCGVKLEKYD